MMKRMLILLLGLFLLCPAAQGEDDLSARLEAATYRLVLRNEDGDTILGSGALVENASQLLTAAGCLREGEIYAVGQDGEHRVLARKTVGPLAALTLETPSSAQPLPLAGKQSKTLPYIRGLDSLGRPLVMPVYAIRVAMEDGEETMLLTSAEGLMPGAFLTDETGGLVGLVIAQQTEGMGAYEALDANTIHALLSGQKQTLYPRISWQDGALIVSWEDEERTGGIYALSISSGRNQYYSSFETAGLEKRISLAVPPGHDYLLEVQWAEDHESVAEPTFAVSALYTVPDVPFEAYDFRMESYLAAAKKGDHVDGLLEPMTVTAAALTDPGSDIYLQVISSYRVSRKISLPMTLELIAPDGQFYFEELGFLFDPAMAGDDSFPIPVGEMIENCRVFSGGTLKAGDYLLRCAIGGKIAGECAFTLTEEAGKPAAAPTAPATKGLIAGLKMERKNGVVAVSWDASSLPGEAHVTVYSLHAGNTYYTFAEYPADAGQADVYCVPGRRTMIWAVWSMETIDKPPMPQKPEEFLLAEAVKPEPLTAHGFRNLRLGIVPSDDPEAESSTELLPQLPLTREILSDRDTPLYFQTEDAYQLEEISENHPLALILCTPEGWCFLEPGYYVFDPAMQESDCWLRDISPLFATYASMAGENAWPRGTYSLIYCIDGQTAGTFEFTLE